MPPRTIDNLGVEVSTRYAEDKKVYDESLIKEARGIPSQTEIEVTAPSFSSEMEELLHAQPAYITWASFLPPRSSLNREKGSSPTSSSPRWDPRTKRSPRRRKSWPN